MPESLTRIFVDFNRHADEPDSFIAYAHQFGGPIPLGEPLLLTDHEELEFEGYVSSVSADLTKVVVKIGPPPRRGRTLPAHLAQRELPRFLGDVTYDSSDEPVAAPA